MDLSDDDAPLEIPDYTATATDLTVGPGEEGFGVTEARSTKSFCGYVSCVLFWLILLAEACIVLSVCNSRFKLEVIFKIISQHPLNTWD